MSSEVVNCEKCGQPLSIGDYPFCPHGSMKSGAMIETDEIPGGRWFENYGPHPVKFYSHSERHRYMQEHGLRELEKFCPAPGTDRDPQGIPNPKGYIDAQTLANATALLARCGVVMNADEGPGRGTEVEARTMSGEEVRHVVENSR